MERRSGGLACAIQISIVKIYSAIAEFALKTEEQELLKRARPTKKYVSRFEAYKSLFVRRSRIHFSHYYMTPLIEKGLVARTDPENPMSPRQVYKLT